MNALMMQRHSQSESVFRAITFYSLLSLGLRAFIIQLIDMINICIQNTCLALVFLFLFISPSIHIFLTFLTLK